ncbi:MAG TPA: hypothetical protein VHY22_06695 [Chthoniobacteraceae bacterium]|nr:hypothetical protein [Chthoniobacteraceae bacterium]
MRARQMNEDMEGTIGGTVAERKDGIGLTGAMRGADLIAIRNLAGAKATEAGVITAIFTGTKADGGITDMEERKALEAGIITTTITIGAFTGKKAAGGITVMSLAGVSMAGIIAASTGLNVGRNGIVVKAGGRKTGTDSTADPKASGMAAPGSRVTNRRLCSTMGTRF